MSLSSFWPHSCIHAFADAKTLELARTRLRRFGEKSRHQKRSLKTSAPEVVTFEPELSKTILSLGDKLTPRLPLPWLTSRPPSQQMKS